MGLLDELKKLTKPYSGEEYDDFDDDFSDEPAETPMPQEQHSQRRYPNSPDRRASFSDYENSRGYENNSRGYESGGRGRESSRGYDSGRSFENSRNYEPSRSYDSGRGFDNSRNAPPPQRRDKVVNLNPGNQMQMVIMKPERFEAAAGIADHLRDRRPVLINMELADKDTVRRLVDFVGGVAYALDAKVSKVANNTFMITPYNVDVMGDQLDGLDSGGYYGGSLY